MSRPAAASEGDTGSRAGSQAMPGGEDWSLPARRLLCGECERELPAGMLVTSMLRFGADGPDRRDLCEDCGQSVESGADDVFWRHRLPEDESRRLVVDYALLREVFEQLARRTEPLYERLAYLVGLVLVRKRLLRLKGFEVRDGREVMRVQRTAADPEMIVPAPHLEPDQLVETRERLGRLLNSDLPDDLSPEQLADALAADPAPPDGAAAPGAGSAAEDGPDGTEDGAEDRAEDGGGDAQAADQAAEDSPEADRAG